MLRNTGEGSADLARVDGTVGHAHVSSIERRRMLEMMHRVGVRVMMLLLCELPQYQQLIPRVFAQPFSDKIK